jgi:hypothetical protein
MKEWIRLTHAHRSKQKFRDATLARHLLTLFSHSDNQLLEFMKGVWLYANKAIS